MDLAEQFIENLTPEQVLKLRAFQLAAEALGDLIKFGDVLITYHQNAPTEYCLTRKFRPSPAGINARR